MRQFGKWLTRTGVVAALCVAMAFSSACGSSSTQTVTTAQTTAASATEASAQDTTTKAADTADTKAETQDAKDASKTSVNQLRPAQTGDIVAELEIRDMGKVTILLFPDQAPLAVENFTTLAQQGYYDGTTFHRVIEDFMIQGGDPTAIGSGGESIYGKFFEDEISPDLFPIYGSLCVANAGKNTNGSQFFVVTSKEVANYSQLEQVAQSYASNYGIQIDYSKMSKQCRNNYASMGGAYWLYCQHTVFGQVLEGMDVVNQIDSVETDSSDRPLEDVVIEKITIKTVE